MMSFSFKIGFAFLNANFFTEKMTSWERVSQNQQKFLTYVSYEIEVGVVLNFWREIFFIVAFIV